MTVLAVVLGFQGKPCAPRILRGDRLALSTFLRGEPHFVPSWPTVLPSPRANPVCSWLDLPYFLRFGRTRCVSGLASVPLAGQANLVFVGVGVLPVASARRTWWALRSATQPRLLQANLVVLRWSLPRLPASGRTRLRFGVACRARRCPGEPGTALLSAIQPTSLLPLFPGQARLLGEAPSPRRASPV